MTVPAAVRTNVSDIVHQQHGMGHGHANAIVAHTLAEDKH
jgi:hypothetical protein